jgi:thymidylate synthase (FAD)|tara:strand:- start:272 stop:952 length:681 start_codon:yes stop_codon:yes gene_type:complete
MTCAVSLAGYTKATKGIEVGENFTDLIAYYARVSNPTSQISGLKNSKLIHYLINHKHWSPFEMVNICLDITTTRDIARQLLRHKSFTGFQEFSQRYASTETNTDLRETRLQDTVNRQNSLANTNAATEIWWKAAQDKVIDQCFSLYDEALKKNIAKEQARVLLPEGLTRTRLFSNASLRSWIHYVELRTDPATQKEHRQLARACAFEIAKVFPDIVEFIQSEKQDN